MDALRRLARVGFAAAALAIGSGCDRDRPATRTVTQGQEPHPGDPHVFACEACHGPAAASPAAAPNWRATCTRSGCHPQAWTRTIFHRVDARTFTDCTTCHRPHTWVADGDDCMSCHASIHGAEGTVAARAIEGAPLFPHQRHAALECDTCHRLETRHADLTLTGRQQCTACHHGPPAAASCTACHRTADFAGMRAPVARLQLDVWPAARERTLPFDHARHDRFECERCHQPQANWAPADNCTACHSDHHRAEADCMSCHAGVGLAVHRLDVHSKSCRECHGVTSPAGVVASRNFCLVCHQDQVQHMPGGNCADCHKMNAGGVVP